MSKTMTMIPDENSAFIDVRLGAMEIDEPVFFDTSGSMPQHSIDDLDREARMICERDVRFSRTMEIRLTDESFRDLRDWAVHRLDIAETRDRTTPRSIKETRRSQRRKR